MYYLSFITKLSINNQRTASIKHLTVATHQQFYLSSQQMLQNSTCRTHDSLLKCNLRRHTFLEKLWFLVRENTDRNILAYHLKKKKYSAHKKRGHVAVVGRMSHHPTQNLQHFKLPPTGPHPLQQCTLSQQTLPFCQL